MQTNSTTVIVHNENHVLHHSSSEKKHPEDPSRLESIVAMLKSSGLDKKCSFVTEISSSSEHLTPTHCPEYIQYIKQLPENSEGDSFHNPNTHAAAESAVSGACLAVDKIFNESYKYAFCAIRPPGHHANMSDGSITGFCVYNNVAIAAKYAREKYQAKKILIFDWDVHHGDSTQKIFYDDPDTLFISIHKYQKGHFYPGGQGGLSYVGGENAKGFNINCPWDVTEEAGCPRTVGDNEYVYLMEAALMPVISAFKPDLVFVSAGFDSGNGDPLGGVALSPYGFSYMLKRLMSLDKKIIMSLEGGYNPTVNANCVEACIKTFLDGGITPEFKAHRWSFDYMKEKATPSKVALDLVERFVLTHSKYWPVLKEDESVVAYREKIKSNLQEFYKEAGILSSMPVSVLIHDKMVKDYDQDEFSLVEIMFLCDHPVEPKLYDGICEHLPTVWRKNKKGMDLIYHDYELLGMDQMSYFVIKVGGDDLKDDKRFYVNQALRFLKVVVRDEKNKIVEKWDENENYGFNYDMKINDYFHDRFILFLRFFLESQGREERPNKKAFLYFREFIILLESWLKEKTDVKFSSITFAFFVNNIDNTFKVCILGFDGIQILKQGELTDHSPGLYPIIKEMKDTLHNDEEFVIEPLVYE